jgi:transcriptional regulator with XRE-family HTH domain
MEKTSGELLKEWREEKKLTQEELAEKSGVSERTIRRIETAGVKPSNATVRKLARALGIHFAGLLGKEWDETEKVRSMGTFNPQDRGKFNLKTLRGLGRFF